MVDLEGDIAQEKTRGRVGDGHDRDGGGQRPAGEGLLFTQESGQGGHGKAVAGPVAGRGRHATVDEVGDGTLDQQRHDCGADSGGSRGEPGMYPPAPTAGDDEEQAGQGESDDGGQGGR